MVNKETQKAIDKDIEENKEMYQALADTDDDMSELNNPMRFTARPRNINIRNWLGEDKQVTEIEFEPGQIYVHWEER
jgi:hypothetical protein